MPRRRSRLIVHWRRKWHRRWPIYVILVLFCITGVAVAFLALSGNDSRIESVFLPKERA
jgi:hypothetical protein